MGADADFDAIAARYREAVAAYHGHLRTIGLPPETVRERDSRADLRLRDLFIPLRLVSEQGSDTPEDLARVLDRRESTVVLGDPGSGKSTLLAYLALLFAGGAVHGDELPPEVPASHGYSFAAVVPGGDETLRLRVWPRRWSHKNKGFTVDTDNTPDKRDYAEHGLELRFKPAPAGPAR